MHRVQLELLYVVGVPLLLASGAAWTHRTGGTRRLWIVAAIGTGLLAVPLLITNSFELYHTGPRSAAGVDTWTLPASALTVAVVTQLLGHRRIPVVIRAGVAAVAAFLVTSLGFWVA